jgi:arsenate reductase-like glutaredoxin family protein
MLEIPAALSLLEDRGVEHEVRLYLKTPPSPDEVLALAGRIGRALREILRRQETPYRELTWQRPMTRRWRGRWPRTRSCWNARSSTPALAR